MKNVLLGCHFGMGDSLICNGLVREHCNIYDKVNIFCKHAYRDSIEFMYKDLKNINIIYVSDWDCEEDQIKIQKHLNDTKTYNLIKIIGYQKLNPYIPNQDSFDTQFYKLADIEFEKKYSSFFVLRDKKIEDDVYNNLVDVEDYIFLHEDVSRDIIIDRSKIQSDLKIITPNFNLHKNIFGYLRILENAKEVHCIDSSFLSLVDIMNLNPKLYFHRYSKKHIYAKDRFCTSFAVPRIQSKWGIID